ncbi:MAG: hypothetical protein HWN67_00090 [Candidatus Helarchaeota archaeon]|nr:hypothetical protein [Candidatus Helarchaeota archaeon]
MEKRCSVVNCQKEVKEGQYKVIKGKIYCIQCAILVYREALGNMGVPID